MVLEFLFRPGVAVRWVITTMLLAPVVASCEGGGRRTWESYAKFIAEEPDMKVKVLAIVLAAAGALYDSQARSEQLSQKAKTAHSTATRHVRPVDYEYGPPASDEATIPVWYGAGPAAAETAWTGFCEERGCCLCNGGCGYGHFGGGHC